jgi:hypothetical protein
LPHLDAEIAAAFVCVETTCYPPVSSPEGLSALLLGSKTGAVANS